MRRKVGDIINVRGREWEIIAKRIPIYGDIFLTPYQHIRYRGTNNDDTHPACWILHPTTKQIIADPVAYLG